jgi:cyclopropane-fatty-acyl-phospholipid synthase
MSARLLNRFLARGIKRGRLEVAYASGESVSFGEPTEGFPEVALRFSDNRVPRDILLDPRIGAGEAYEHLVPPPVARLIEELGLYRDQRMPAVH